MTQTRQTTTRPAGGGAEGPTESCERWERCGVSMGTMAAVGDRVLWNQCSGRELMGSSYPDCRMGAARLQHTP